MQKFKNHRRTPSGIKVCGRKKERRRKNNAKFSGSEIVLNLILSRFEQITFEKINLTFFGVDDFFVVGVNKC